MRPGSRRYAPAGTRVCVQWSSKLSFLHPGTVETAGPGPAPPAWLPVRLDDGDCREVPLDSVRLLPRGYPRVESPSKQSPIGQVSGKAN